DEFESDDEGDDGEQHEVVENISDEEEVADEVNDQFITDETPSIDCKPTSEVSAESDDTHAKDIAKCTRICQSFERMLLERVNSINQIKMILREEIKMDSDMIAEFTEVVAIQSETIENMNKYTEDQKEEFEKEIAKLKNIATADIASLNKTVEALTENLKAAMEEAINLKSYGEKLESQLGKEQETNEALQKEKTEMQSRLQITSEEKDVAIAEAEVLRGNLKAVT
ncbi:hypothetical protein ACHAWT_009800, partial [Skeletonema menzelii]